MDRRSRYRGGLLGLAAGDALGATVEFESPGSFVPVSDIVGGGPHQLQPGEWTDDTSMALCMAESLIARGEFDALDQLQNYCRWHRQGHWSCKGHCFDIGGTTWEALTTFERDPRRQFCGPTEDYKAGNGSLMRLAPAPLFYARRPDDAVFYAAQSSRTTHGAGNALMPVDTWVG